MIASLAGRVASREPALVVDVGGVGFGVQVSARTAALLPGVGDKVALFTYLYVREDHLSLYGFASAEERSLFLLFLEVKGVGPRVALTLLSSAPLEELQRAVQEGDEAYLVRLPGVGKKTAARLVVELQGKMPQRAAEAAARTSGLGPKRDEAVLALVSLGLTARAARDAVEQVADDGLPEGARVEDIVKAALRTGVESAG